MNENAHSKRPRAQGCYQRGKNARKWWIAVDQPRGTDGKRKRQWHKFDGTMRQAQAERTRLLHNIQTGLYIEPSKENIAAFLERWLQHIQGRVAKKTFERYSQIAKMHLTDAFGTIQLAKLSAADISAAYDRWQGTGARARGKGGLSPQTIIHHHRVLRQALGQALKWGLVLRNVADAVEPPRRVRPEIRTLSEAEAAVLLGAAEGTRLVAPIYVLLTSGVRRGELLALRWSDLDTNSAMLSVRRSVELTGSGVGFKLPKSGQSRAITLAKGTLEALRKHRIAQNADRLMWGSAYKSLDLIFAREDGSVWNPDALSKAFEDLVKRTNIGHVRLHDLRHSCASLMLKSGVHAKVVSERLGHSTISITLDLYSHVLPGLQEAAADKLDAALGRAIAARE